MNYKSSNLQISVKYVSEDVRLSIKPYSILLHFRLDMNSSVINSDMDIRTQPPPADSKEIAINRLIFTPPSTDADQGSR